jgi:hypothetical protein
VIGAKKVTAPDGTRWRVGRRWLPDWPRFWDRRDPGDGGDGSWMDLGGFDDALGIGLALIAIVLLVLLFTTVIVPVIALTIELLVVIVLLVGGIVGRLVFRKPWEIRARREGDKSQLRWHATGFRRSGRVRDEVAAALAQGRTDVRPTEAITAP